jgi:hypothetical protein
MTFDPLIDRLSRDLKPVPVRRSSREFVIIAAVCVVEIIVVFALGAALPDMPRRMQQPTFWWRLASLGLIALISGIPAILSFNPTYSARRKLRWVFVVIGVCLGVGLCINAGPDDLESLVRRIDWTNGIQCAGKMIALSVPLVLGLGALMRRGAPTDRNGTALLVGIAGAAWGAFVFVFACPFNDPLYIAVWYSISSGAVVMVSRAILPRLSRW